MVGMPKKKNILNEKITRREFIKKSAVAVAGVGIGAYAFDSILKLRSFSTVFKNDAPQELWKWSKEASYYTKYPNYVKCNLCPNGCILMKNDRGICRTRVNKNGKLYTLTYGNPCTIHIDPIEKKPFFHFLPSTLAFSIATAGCNLRCKFCQNWEISQAEPHELRNYDLMPNNLVKACLSERTKNEKIKSIAYTYSEPAVFYEYMIDTSEAAKKQGLRNVVVTAGYLNKDPFIKLAKTVDAIKIDLKGFNEKFYRDICSAELQGVLNACKVVHSQNVWFEIVNLVVPRMNDDIDEIRAMSEWIKTNLGPDVPLHFSRFYPMYQLKTLPPTPIETLKKARETAIDEGLNYVYIGNVSHGDYENTYCPSCNKLLIERIGYYIKQFNIENGRCKFCGYKIPGTWK